MARNCAILGLGGSVADRDHIEYVPLSILGLAAFGVTHLPPCTQLCRQLLLQHAARLNKETAIDRFVISDVSVGGTAASANRRSPGDIAAQASAPRAIVTPHGAPGDKVLGRSARSRGAPLGPVCTVSLRTAVASANLPAYRRWRSFETSCDPTDRPAGRNPTGNLFALLKLQCRHSSATRRRSDPSIESHDPLDAGLVPPFQRPGDG